MDEAGQWEARLAAVESQGEPDESELFPERYLQLYADPEEPPPPGEDDISAELIAECREISAEEVRATAYVARLGQTAAMAAIAASLGRRGPGMPGSAHRFPGEYPGPAAGFATGHPLDVAPGCTALALLAEDAAGDDDTYAGATDDELVGVICALDRSEASLAARKHAAVAELIRRRPAPPCRVRRGCRRAQDCDHRFQAPGHDPGARLRHLTQIRHATCTGPTCRRPASQCDFEHNTPFEAGGRTCLCTCNPTCRHDHRLKQHPRWKVEQITPAIIRWTTPAGRQYITELTRYPI